MKSMRSILTTLVSLFVAAVVLLALITLGVFLLYSKSSAVHDRVHDLHTELLRGDSVLPDADEAAPSPATEQAITDLQNRVVTREEQIAALQRELHNSLLRSQKLEQQLQESKFAESIPPPPPPADESALNADNLALQKIALAPKVSVIKQFQPDHNFAVLEVNPEANFDVGQVLGVRQAREVVAKIRITGVDKSGIPTADVVSVLPGKNVRSGDDVIVLPQ